MSKTLKYKQLEKELSAYITILGKAADAVIQQDVSDYPIFIAHQQVMDMGIPIIEKEKVKGNWSVHVSSLEEFVTKQVIQSDKIDEFKNVYKDPEGSLCLFVLSELGASFIFLPREISE